MTKLDMGIGLHDMMDAACADALGVSVEEYIRVVEDVLSFDRANAFIGGLLSEDENKIEQCKRIYNKYCKND
jgi:hypothetical protein